MGPWSRGCESDLGLSITCSIQIRSRALLKQAAWTVERIMHGNALLLGADGGGTQCRARLTSASGAKLGEGTGGPANIRFGLEQSFVAILDATRQCLRQAGLGNRDFSRI